MATKTHDAAIEDERGAGPKVHHLSKKEVFTSHANTTILVNSLLLVVALQLLSALQRAALMQTDAAYMQGCIELGIDCDVQSVYFLFIGSMTVTLSFLAIFMSFGSLSTLLALELVPEYLRGLVSKNVLYTLATLQLFISVVLTQVAALLLF